MEDTNLTKQALNNEMEAVKRKLKQAQVCVINKLVKSSKRKTFARETQEDGTAKVKTDKKTLILQDIFELKKLNLREVAKFSLTNTKTLAEVSGNITGKEKAMMRVVDQPMVKAIIASFRKKYPSWQVQVPSLFEIFDFQRNVLKKLPKNEVKRRAKAKRDIISEYEGNRNLASKKNIKRENQVAKLPENMASAKTDSFQPEEEDGTVVPTEGVQISEQVTSEVADQSSNSQEKEKIVADRDSTREKRQNTGKAKVNNNLKGKTNKIPKLTNKNNRVVVEDSTNQPEPEVDENEVTEKNFIYATELDLNNIKNAGTSLGAVATSTDQVSIDSEVGDSSSNEQACVSNPTDTEPKIESESLSCVDGIADTKPKTIKRHLKIRKSAKKVTDKLVKKVSVDRQRTSLERAVMAEKLRKLAEVETIGQDCVRGSKRSTLNFMSSILKVEGDSEIRHIKLRGSGEDDQILPSRTKRRKAAEPGKEGNIYKMKSAFFMGLDDQRFSDEEPVDQDAENPKSEKKTDGKKNKSCHVPNRNASCDFDASAIETGSGGEGNSSHDEDAPPKQPKLHPSWIAKKQQRNTGVALAHRGKKVYFDGDTNEDDQVDENPDQFYSDPDSFKRNSDLQRQTPLSRIRRRQRRAALLAGDRTSDDVDAGVKEPDRIHFDRSSTNKNDFRDGPISRPKSAAPFSSPTFYKDQASKPAKESNLHPSWAAKKKQGDTGLALANQGKKIVFDDDATDNGVREPEGLRTNDYSKNKNESRNWPPSSRDKFNESGPVGRFSQDASRREPIPEQTTPSNLHPSWAAKLMQRDTGLALANQGKKITFNNDSVDDACENPGKAYSEKREDESRNTRIKSAAPSGNRFFQERTSAGPIHKEVESNLHPSWAAKMKQRDTGLTLANQGKKITFSD